MILEWSAVVVVWTQIYANLQSTIFPSSSTVFTTYPTTVLPWWITPSKIGFSSLKMWILWLSLLKIISVLPIQLSGFLLRLSTPKNYWFLILSWIAVVLDILREQGQVAAISTKFLISWLGVLGLGLAMEAMEGTAALKTAIYSSHLPPMTSNNCQNTQEVEVASSSKSCNRFHQEVESSMFKLIL